MQGREDRPHQDRSRALPVPKGQGGQVRVVTDTHPRIPPLSPRIFFYWRWRRRHRLCSGRCFLRCCRCFRRRRRRHLSRFAWSRGLPEPAGGSAQRIGPPPAPPRLARVRRGPDTPGLQGSLKQTTHLLRYRLHRGAGDDIIPSPSHDTSF